MRNGDRYNLSQARIFVGASLAIVFILPKRSISTRGSTFRHSGKNCCCGARGLFRVTRHSQLYSLRCCCARMITIRPRRGGLLSSSTARNNFQNESSICWEGGIRIREGEAGLCQVHCNCFHAPLLLAACRYSCAAYARARLLQRASLEQWGLKVTFLEGNRSTAVVQEFPLHSVFPWNATTPGHLAAD